MSAARRSAAILLAVVVTALTLGTAPAEAQTAAGYASTAFVATNVQRVAHARVPLRHQRCVQKYAVRQAARMARQDRMFHQDLYVVLRDCGLRKAGENVAYGYSSGRSVVNDGWMRSPGHRRNILDGTFRILGLAARQSDDGTWYAAQVFGRRA
jgi:uncharacterized protein YkwD